MGNLNDDIQSKFKNEKVKAMLNIIYSANWINSKLNTFFKSFDLSHQQFNILRILNGADEPLKVQTIKERMVERAPNATRLMDKLCAKELINRIQCPDDRRVVHIIITEKGKELLHDINKSMTFDVLENLTIDEAKVMNELLDKMR
ncbi:MAG: MarR family winged helix-turn-helix transcriptional regulator [bacterium]